MNWTTGENKHEVINCLTGKLETGGSSRVCKLALFKKFMYLRNKLSSITGMHSKKDEHMLYCQAKDGVETYNVSCSGVVESSIVFFSIFFNENKIIKIVIFFCSSEIVNFFF